MTVAGCGKQRTQVGSELVLKESSAIYGKDDRKDVYTITKPEILNLTKFVGAQISSYALGYDSSNSNYYIMAQTLRERKSKLCLTQTLNFHDQISPAKCSGFLIAPNLYLTKGHCLTNRDKEGKPEEIKHDEIEKISAINLSPIRIVFNFFQKADKSEIRISPKDIYTVKSIVEINYSDSSDFAILELDRNFPEKINLKFETEKKTKLNDPLIMIGAPGGIPIKVTDNGKVRQIEKREYVTDLDAFHGNSGSMVYNLRTKEVIGTLDSGEDDYIEDKKNKCERVNVYTKKRDIQKGGEYVEKILRLIKDYPNYFPVH